MRAGAIGSKVKQYSDTTATVATVSSLVEETGGSLTVGTNRVCSDGKSREDKCGNGMPKSAGRVCASVRFIYHGSRLWK